MAHRVGLEQLEQLARELPPTEQLELVAYLCQQLSATPLAGQVVQNTVEPARAERMAKVDAWIAECDKVAELWEGEFDATADLRRIRDEETWLCPNPAWTRALRSRGSSKVSRSDTRH
jgi:hypothetical protein